MISNLDSAIIMETGSMSFDYKFNLTKPIAYHNN